MSETLSLDSHIQKDLDDRNVTAAQYRNDLIERFKARYRYENGVSPDMASSESLRTLSAIEMLVNENKRQ